MESLDRFVRCLRSCGVAPGSSLGLAVSGGPDSMAMLELARQTAPRLSLRLHVLHVDHCLRVTSPDDADFVVSHATAHGLGCSVLRSPVACDQGESLESAARTLRYFLLDRAADELRLDAIATGHTLDDQAETVLLRLLRGAGAGSLQGIRARRGRIVRPLLTFRHAELAAVLEDAGVGAVVDGSNADERFERNWLRSRVMPVIEARRPGAVRAVAGLADRIAEDASALDDIADGIWATSVRKVEDHVLSIAIEDLVPLPRAVAARVVLRMIAAAGGRADARRAGAVLDLLAEPGAGKRVDCGKGVGAYRGDHDLIVGLRVNWGLEPAPPARLPENGTVRPDGWHLRVRIAPEGPQEPWWWRCRLDAAEAADLWVRPPLRGDRVRTAAGSKKVHDVLVDAKVPRPYRGRVPVLTSTSGELAVVGLTCPPPPSGPGPHVIVDVDPEEPPLWMPRSTPS